MSTPARATRTLRPRVAPPPTQTGVPVRKGRKKARVAAAVPRRMTKAQRIQAENIASERRIMAMIGLDPDSLRASFERCLARIRAGDRRALDEWKYEHEFARAAAAATVQQTAMWLDMGLDANANDVRPDVRFRILMQAVTGARSAAAHTAPQRRAVMVEAMREFYGEPGIEPPDVVTDAAAHWVETGALTDYASAIMTRRGPPPEEHLERSRSVSLFERELLAAHAARFP